MRNKFIRDYTKGEVITDYFMVKDASVKETRDGKNFAALTIADKSGELQCKKWDISGFEKDWFETILVAGDIVKVRGTVDVYNDSPQMIIDKIRHAGGDDKFDLSDIVKTAPLAPEKMYEEILKVISGIADDDYRNICLKIYQDNKDRFLYYPAAKMIHHAHHGGLLWHTYRMVQTAVKLTEVYASVNSSLLVAGTALHDIGKLFEMDSNEYGIVSDYTIKGQLLGHLMMGPMMIEDTAKQLGTPEEKKLLLEHLLASHHGKDPAMGSAHKPCVLEAYLLHEIDMMDMFVYVAEEELEKIEGGEMTPSLFALGRDKLYKPTE